MIRLPIILFLFLAAGCGPKKTIADYSEYKFDKQVIDKLPVYDSLIYAILENYKSFQPYIEGAEDYHAYRYFPEADSTDLFKKLPGQGAARINQYFTQLGKNFIYGFDLFKDSSIKIYVRNSYSTKDQLEIRENLSYYPPGTNTRKREYPTKDTLLNKQLQYWIEFGERGPF